MPVGRKRRGHYRMPAYLSFIQHESYRKKSNFLIAELKVTGNYSFSFP